MTKQAFAACTSEKELVLVDGAEHGKSYVLEPSRVQAALKAFLDAHV